MGLSNCDYIRVIFYCYVGVTGNKLILIFIDSIALIAINGFWKQNVENIMLRRPWLHNIVVLVKVIQGVTVYLPAEFQTNCIEMAL